MQETDEHKEFRKICDEIKRSPGCRAHIGWLETILTIVHPCNILYKCRLASALGNFMEFAELSGLLAALCLCLWILSLSLDDSCSFSDSLSLDDTHENLSMYASDPSYSHSHALAVTCTRCYDEIKGTQDQDIFLCSFSDSLTLSLVRVVMIVSK